MKPVAGTRSKPPSKARAQSYRKGHVAEALAALLLTAKGYRILARRFRSPMGEIDLIAKRGHRIAFVEVKARATWQDGAWSVGPRQQARIARAAEAWRKRNPRLAAHEMSFDVVLVAPRRLPRHIAHAFRV